MVFWAITQITLITDTRALEMQGVFNGTELKASLFHISFESTPSVIVDTDMIFTMFKKIFSLTFFTAQSCVHVTLFRPTKYYVSESVFNTLIKLRQASKGV